MINYLYILMKLDKVFYTYFDQNNKIKITLSVFTRIYTCVNVFEVLIF